MIYTVTFNPSLDYVVQMDHFQGDAVNLASTENVYPGGKGNNVAVIAARLGMKSRALGFRAGFTGDAMERMLRECGCDTDLIPLEDGMTRINVKVNSDREFEINGRGPAIPEEKVEQLYRKLDALEEGDVLVLSGSIPGTMPSDMYERIMKRLEGRTIQICVDARQELLLKVLRYHPFLIKPNDHELGEMFGRTLHSDQEILEYAGKLQEMGARNVLVSMAGDGAVLLAENGEVQKQLPPEGTVVNSVGAGDSMVAGFLTGYLRNGDYRDALMLGTAAGSATAFTSWLAEYGAIEELWRQISGREEIFITETAEGE